jgi:Domain of unknown function (DUF6443)
MKIFALIFLLLMQTFANAEDICLLTRVTYTPSSPPSGFSNVSTSLIVSGGNVVFTSGESITIEWNTPGVGYAKKNFTGSSSFGTVTGTYWETYVNIVSVPPLPTTPVVQSYGCGSAVIAFSGTPPAGVTWYWQDNISGVSTANSASSLTVNEAKSYYLRAYSSCGWSSQSSILNVSNLTPCEWQPKTLHITAISAGLQNSLPIDIMDITKANVDVNYFDLLGRLNQTVGIKKSPMMKDLVIPITYDNIGRENKKYLPVVTNTTDGGYKPNLIDPTTGGYINQALNFYSNGTTDKIADDTRPFSETIFEPSPLNRPLQDFGAGQNWKDNNRSVQHQYIVNAHGTAAGQEQIIAWKLDAAGQPVRETAVNTSVGGGYYTTGQLSIKSTKDEQGNEVREYTDKEGRTILKKVQAVAGSPALSDTNAWAQTYYIYDDLGNLVMVLPPEAVKKITGQ